MRVAIVLNTSWNIFNFRMGLVRQLLSENHTVFAIAPCDTYSKLLTEAGCNYVPVKMDSRGANVIKDLGLMVELLLIYNRIKPDIIFHFTIKPNVYGSIAARLLGIPMINNVCGLGTVFLTNNLTSKIALILYKFSFKFPDKVFFQNKDDREKFVKLKLIRETKSDLLPGSGINLMEFTPSVKNEKTTLTFLMISRLIIDKGILEYVKAAEILKKNGIDAVFQLVGPSDIEHKRGISHDVIDNWSCTLNVDYLGKQNNIQSFIAKADCIVLPSYREGTPRTLLEAAGMAKPIIATNVPGCTNVVFDHENGYLCNLKDPKDLADKMLKFSRLSAAERTRMGKRGRRIVEELFDEKIVIRSYVNAMSVILK